MKKKVIGMALAALVLLLAAAVAMVALLGNLNRFKPVLTRQLENAFNRAVAVKGNVTVGWGLPPTLVVNDMTLANAEWGSQPQMAVLRRIEVTPDWWALIAGKLHFERIAVHGATVALEKDSKGRWNLPSPRRGGAAGATPKRLPFTEFNLTDGRLSLHASGREHMVKIERFNLAVGGKNRPTVGQARLRYKDVPLTVNASFSPTSAILEPGNALTADLSLQAEKNILAVKGTVASLTMPPQLEVDFELDSRNPQVLTTVMSLPAGFDEGFRVTGRLHGLDREKRYRLSGFHFESGPNDADGWFEFAPFRQPLRVTADVTSRHFDLRPYLRKADQAQAQAAEPAAEKIGRFFSPEPFNLSLLERIDAEASLKVGVLKLPRLGLQHLEAKMKLENGRLDLKPVGATIGNGDFEAELHLASAVQVQVDAAAEVRRLDAAQMLQTLDLPPSIRGDIGFKFKIKGQGASPAKLAGSLDGRFSLVMQDGQIAARYLRRAELYGFELTDAFLKLFRPDEQQKTEYAKIDCAVCRFDISDGIAQSNVLVFDTARAGVVGDGQIDLKNEKLDIALKPVTGGIGIPGLAKLKVGTSSIADSFKLGGTLLHPEITLDKSESALTLGKAIGGMVLFGPVGLTAALLETEFGAKNPCVEALKKAGAVKNE